MIYFLDLENWDGKTSRENLSLYGKYKFKDLEYISCTLEDQDGTMSGGSCSQRENVTNCHHYPSVPLREDIAKFFILYYFFISYLYYLCYLNPCDNNVIATIWNSTSRQIPLLIKWWKEMVYTWQKQK